jgi:hypothetical protein
MHSNFTGLLLYIDVICFMLLSIHLTDIDTALKVVASLTVIAVNFVVLYKHFKKSKK